MYTVIRPVTMIYTFSRNRKISFINQHFIAIFIKFLWFDWLVFLLVFFFQIWMIFCVFQNSRVKSTKQQHITLRYVTHCHSLCDIFFCFLLSALHSIFFISTTCNCKVLLVDSSASVFTVIIYLTLNVIQAKTYLDILFHTMVTIL